MGPPHPAPARPRPPRGAGSPRRPEGRGSGRVSPQALGCWDLVTPLPLCTTSPVNPGSWKKASGNFRKLLDVSGNFGKVSRHFRKVSRNFWKVSRNFRKLSYIHKYSVFENRAFTNHSSTIHQPFINPSSTVHPFINRSSTIHQSFREFLETFQGLPSGFRVQGGCSGLSYRGDRNHRPKRRG